MRYLHLIAIKIRGIFSNSAKHKKLSTILFTSIFSAIIGALATVLFYPAIQRIEYDYWKKKYMAETNRMLIDKRVDTVQEFHAANTKFKDCVSKFTTASTTRELSDGPVYLKEFCDDELVAIWNAGFKANIYFDQEGNAVRNELQNLNDQISMYVFKTALSPFRTESYIEKMTESLNKTEQLMQEHTFVF